MRNIEETFGTLTTPIFILYGSKKEKREERREKTFEEIISRKLS